MTFNPDWKEVVVPIDEYRELIQKIGELSEESFKLETKLNEARNFILALAVCGNGAARKVWLKIKDEDQKDIAD